MIMVSRYRKQLSENKVASQMRISIRYKHFVITLIYKSAALSLTNLECLYILCWWLSIFGFIISPAFTRSEVLGHNWYNVNPDFSVVYKFFLQYWKFINRISCCQLTIKHTAHCRQCKYYFQSGKLLRHISQSVKYHELSFYKFNIVCSRKIVLSGYQRWIFNFTLTLFRRCSAKMVSLQKSI